MNTNVEFIDVRNGNNQLITAFNCIINPNLACIYVDDASASYLENWWIDENSTFVETEQDCIDLSLDDKLINQVVIYPNPVKDFLYFDNITNIEQGTIKIYNILGKLVFIMDIIDNKLDISSLDIGTYFLSLETEKGKINQKIIKY